eukprot:evm.model.scf_1690.4 EVM.evm.TU.scf_1690.4   scf_1690:23945-25435(-)
MASTHSTVRTSGSCRGEGRFHRECGEWRLARQLRRMAELGGRLHLQDAFFAVCVVAAIGSALAQAATGAPPPPPEGHGSSEPWRKGDDVKLPYVLVVVFMLWRARASLTLNLVIGKGNVAKATAFTLSVCDFFIWLILGIGSSVLNSTSAGLLGSVSAGAITLSVTLMSYALLRALCLGVCSWFRDATWKMVDIFRGPLPLQQFDNLDETLCDASIQAGWTLLKVIPSLTYHQEWLRQVRSLILVTEPLTNQKMNDVAAAARECNWTSSPRTIREMDEAITGGRLWRILNEDGNPRAKYVQMGQFDSVLMQGSNVTSRARNFRINNNTHGVGKAMAFAWTCLIKFHMGFGNWTNLNRRSIVNLTMLFLLVGLAPRVGSGRKIEIDVDEILYVYILGYAPIPMMWLMSMLTGFNMFWMEMQGHGPRNAKFVVWFFWHVLWNIGFYHFYPVLLVISLAFSCAWAFVPVIWKIVQYGNFCFTGPPEDWDEPPGKEIVLD